MDETKQYLRHVNDIVRRVENHQFSSYTDFLLPQEYKVLSDTKGLFDNVYTLFWGGYLEFERGMLCISPQPDILQDEFPIVCLHAEQTDRRFAEELTHRDFLGSLMNLGIARNVFGDLLANTHDAFLFCSEKMAPFLLEEWVKVKHSPIRCEMIPQWDPSFFTQRMDIKQGTVASTRLDSLLAFSFSLSRTTAQQLIKRSEVAVNHMTLENTSYLVKENDLISVHGYGRFIIEDIGNLTRKERIWVTVKKYR